MLRRHSLVYHECLSSNCAIVGREDLHKHWSLHLMFSIIFEGSISFSFLAIFFPLFLSSVVVLSRSFSIVTLQGGFYRRPQHSSISATLYSQLLSLNLLPPKPFTSFTPATLSFPFPPLRPRFRLTLRREKRKKANKCCDVGQCRRSLRTMVSRE